MFFCPGSPLGDVPWFWPGRYFFFFFSSNRVSVLRKKNLKPSSNSWKLDLVWIRSLLTRTSSNSYQPKWVLNTGGFLDSKAILGLVSFQGIRPSPCTTCFMLLVMGLGLRFCVFLLLGPLIVCSAVWGVVFCLDFDLFFFFFSCSLVECYLFIIALTSHKTNIVGFTIYAYKPTNAHHLYPKQ